MPVVLIPAKTNLSPDLNTNLIPEAIRMKITSAAYDATRQFFKQPGVREDFEAWKAERAARLKKGA